jgi:hypothetical protein
MVNSVFTTCSWISPTDCTYTSSIVYGRWYHAGCTYPERKRQKKNPFVLRGYRPNVVVRIGRTAKKKESFKKASQVVMSRVGIIDAQ